MGILEIIRTLFKRGEETRAVPPQMPEEITAFLQPRTLIERGAMNCAEAEIILDEFSSSLEEAIAIVYGNSFTREDKKERGALSYTFSREGMVVKYYTAPVTYTGRDDSAGEGVYRGKLFIRGKDIELQNAGELLRKLQESTVLESDGKDFVIVYDAQREGNEDGRVSVEGAELLKSMNFLPENTCRFRWSEPPSWRYEKKV